jgi:diphthamide biosynthesis protein 7
MGVTTIQSNPFSEYKVAVGSYDESLSVWDTRAMKEPWISHQMGSGVWRVKWHPQTDKLVLAACMRAGFKILKINEDKCKYGQ